MYRPNVPLEFARPCGCYQWMIANAINLITQRDRVLRDREVFDHTGHVREMLRRILHEIV